MARPYVAPEGDTEEAARPTRHLPEYWFALYIYGGTLRDQTEYVLPQLAMTSFDFVLFPFSEKYGILVIGSHSAKDWYIPKSESVAMFMEIMSKACSWVFS